MKKAARIMILSVSGSVRPRPNRLFAADRVVATEAPTMPRGPPRAERAARPPAGQRGPASIFVRVAGDALVTCSASGARWIRSEGRFDRKVGLSAASRLPAGRRRISDARCNSCPPQIARAARGISAASHSLALGPIGPPQLHCPCRVPQRRPSDSRGPIAGVQALRARLLSCRAPWASAAAKDALLRVGHPTAWSTPSAGRACTRGGSCARRSI